MAELCNSCLYDSNHPFGLTIQDGLCSGCLTHKEKDELDWVRRAELLKEIVKSRKITKKKHFYDCVIPVQGDAEDYYVVSKVLELKLSPLIVCVNDYFKNDIGWHNFHNLITHFDLDSFVYNPELSTYKEMIRTTLRKSNHILWPALALHTSFPVHVALDRNIPLVIWGQNQSIEQVGKFSHIDEVEMTKWSRIEHDLFGRDIDVTIGTGAQVNPRSLNYYRYPDIKKLSKLNVTGIYLSNYFRWDSFFQNSRMVEYGFIPQKNYASFDSYERAGSSVYYQIHDLLKLERKGYRKIRDHLVREIRHGRILKADAEKLEYHYSKSKVDLNGFFDWLGATSSGRRWFIDEKLSSVKALIGSETEHSVPDLPDEIEKLYSYGERINQDFIKFGKGISLGI